MRLTCEDGTWIVQVIVSMSPAWAARKNVACVWAVATRPIRGVSKTAVRWMPVGSRPSWLEERLAAGPADDDLVVDLAHVDDELGVGLGAEDGRARVGLVVGDREARGRQADGRHVEEEGRIAGRDVAVNEEDLVGRRGLADVGQDVIGIPRVVVGLVIGRGVGRDLAVVVDIGARRRAEEPVDPRGPGLLWSLGVRRVERLEMEEQVQVAHVDVPDAARTLLERPPRRSRLHDVTGE
jgi:hypothetical protein